MEELKKYKTVDILFIALIGAVLGYLNMFAGVLDVPVKAIFGPLAAAAYSGIFYNSGILSGYIVRKPGSAFFSEWINTITQLLAGNPFGIMLLVCGPVQGIGSELGYASGRYKKYKWPYVVFAGALPGVTSFIFDYFYFMYGQLTVEYALAILVTRIVSGALIGGVFFGLVIGNLLIKTGVTRPVLRIETPKS